MVDAQPLVAMNRIGERCGGVHACRDVTLTVRPGDPMAEGAYLAAKASDRHEEIDFVGIDALPLPFGGVKAVEQGGLSATFTYPTGGAEAVEAAKKLLISCEDVKKEQVLKTRLITKEDAAKAYREDDTAG